MQTYFGNIARCVGEVLGVAFAHRLEIDIVVDRF